MWLSVRVLVEHVRAPGSILRTTGGRGAGALERVTELGRGSAMGKPESTEVYQGSMLFLSALRQSSPPAQHGDLEVLAG